MISPIRFIENTPGRESQFSLAETFPQVEKAPFQLTERQTIPKKKLSGFVFILNIISMLFFCHVSPYYFFAPISANQTKGLIAGCSIGLILFVTLPTLLYLAPVRKIIQLCFLMDTIMLASILGVMAFVSMILIFDKGGTWYYPTIQVSFTISIFFYSTIVRVLLVTLKWSKWKVIVFKIHLMMNGLMFFVSGVYFICVDFTYTHHMLREFDQKVHDFMLLFIFSMFGVAYEFYGKVTDLDRTGDLKYIYKIKNMDETYHQKRKEIIQKKRESLNSLRILEQNEAMKRAVKEYKASRFANILETEA